MSSTADRLREKLIKYTNELEKNTEEAKTHLLEYAAFDEARFEITSGELQKSSKRITKCLSRIEEIVDQLTKACAEPDKDNELLDSVDSMVLSSEMVLADVEDVSSERALAHCSGTSDTIKKPRLTGPATRIKTSFEKVIGKPYFVDKMLMIRRIIDLLIGSEENGDPGCQMAGDPLLITAPRRFGKTTNLEMLECFFEGLITKESFSHTKIGKDTAAFDWYGKFTVISITFGHCIDHVDTRDKCIEACRFILRQAFKKYQHMVDYLPEAHIEAFKKWIDSEKYRDKSEAEILEGLRLLLQCARCYETKPVFLLIDEFDKICCEAIFVAGQHLTSIISFYCNMVAQAVKHHPVCSAAVFTGVTAITCRGLSSLNNLEWYKFLDNEEFYAFYDVTGEEFEELMKRELIPEKVRKQKELAQNWYNGYLYQNIKIFNTYSVVNFITHQAVELYWKRSGLAEGLSAAIKQDLLRKKKIRRLLNHDESMNLKLEELQPENFRQVQDKCLEPIDPDFIFNFLLQQGYLTIVKKIDAENAVVKIPNYEIREDFNSLLCEFYTEVYKFDPQLINVCRNSFMNMNMSSDHDCKENLTKVKEALRAIFGKTLKKSINEAWFESFLFSIFFQNAEVSLQKKVLETSKKNDLRTCKILDKFVATSDRCFLFETMKVSGKEVLAKIIEKKYYNVAENEELPYILIGVGVGENEEGFVDLTMSFLLNKNSGEGVIV